MGFKYWKYARRVDADTMNLYTPDNVNALQIDTATANTVKIFGKSATAQLMYIYANQTDSKPYIYLGNDQIVVSAPINTNVNLDVSGTGYVKFGTYAAKAAEAFAGYISIKDSSNNVRKVMVCA